ncbi:MAG: hypothetical protein JSU96_11390 [Acidobacteriota bacterium]|nr:MAG: hypothetical protein JSU96_11390 [Acidobacteriota bacterium]
MKRITLSCLLLVLVLSTFTVLAQEDEKTVYFHAGSWDVPRAKWGDFTAYFEKYEKAVLEKLVADGILVEWGFAANTLHSPDGYSHSIWMGAHSVAGLDKALKAFYEAQGENAAQVEAELAALVTKHQDTITRTFFYGTRSGRLEGGHLLGSSRKVKSGRMSDYRKAWGAWVKPVYEKLLAEGTIVGYTLETEWAHTSEPGEVITWYLVEDLAAEEKVDAAFAAVWESLNEVERNARMTYWRDMTVAGHHRDLLDQVIYSQFK